MDNPEQQRSGLWARTQLWIIGMAIKRVPQLVITVVQILSANIVLSGIMAEDAELMLWEHVGAALTIILTAAIQWFGAQWSGTAIKVMQESDGALPDGLPHVQSIAAAKRNKPPVTGAAEPYAPFAKGRPGNPKR